MRNKHSLLRWHHQEFPVSHHAVDLYVLLRRFSTFWSLLESLPWKSFTGALDEVAGQSALAQERAAAQLHYKKFVD